MTFMDRRDHCGGCNTIMYPGITTNYNEYTDVECCGVCGYFLREVADTLDRSNFVREFNYF